MLELLNKLFGGGMHPQGAQPQATNLDFLGSAVDNPGLGFIGNLFDNANVPQPNQVASQHSIGMPGDVIQKLPAQPVDTKFDNGFAKLLDMMIGEQLGVHPLMSLFGGFNGQPSPIAPFGFGQTANGVIGAMFGDHK